MAVADQENPLIEAAVVAAVGSPSAGAASDSPCSFAAKALELDIQSDSR